MNRKQKIILSVTSILIALLLLMGLTYAYYVTQIIGNSKEKSVLVTSSYLSLVYGDGTNSIISSETPIEAGKVIGTKDFTVTNNGNDTIDSYAVVLEDFAVVYDNAYTNNGEPTEYVYPEDLKLTITCTSTVTNKTCAGFDGALPTSNEILVTNTIDAGEVHNYVMELEYLYTDKDQTVDMGKNIQGKINIIDTYDTIDLEGTVDTTSDTYELGDYVEVNSEPKTSQIKSDGSYKIVGLKPGEHKLYIKSAGGEIKGIQDLIIDKGKEININTSTNTVTFTDAARTLNVDINDDYSLTIDTKIKGYNPFDENTLAYSILDNAQNALNESNTTRTIYSPEPLTNPGLEISGKDEKTLSITQDNYGTTYYFRGNNTDNYLTFSNMCFRIVRIEGDGAIRIILADKDSPCSGGTYSSNNRLSSFIGAAYYGYITEEDGSLYIDYENSENNELALKNVFNTWFDGTRTDGSVNFNDEAKSKLRLTSQCIGDTTTKWDDYDGHVLTQEELDEQMELYGTHYWYYESYLRLVTYNGVTMKCNGIQTEPDYVYPISADEVAYVGMTQLKNLKESNFYTYLRDNARQYWWTVTPSHRSHEKSSIFYIRDTGGIWDSFVNTENRYVRPVVTLKAGTTATGDGTLTNPYIVS